ncbi:hypothetical protein BBF96_08795 [Anoxybacter fermentans]|uniref:Bacterial toxin 44 domain-containing protein n=1 Tax=Anoxybacter fermentans TaxID=1323375 RepID=A0A3Q9HSH8_9FIRM|nr:RHS repeat-associated core domain-containing protein [Anoxybacter fermentans]AZR73470.1 hypothetical protein BBF96_08795 [Anoxybacter fermentans]
MTDGTGKLVWEQDYLPFGEDLHKPGTSVVDFEVETRYKFTGQRQVVGIGLYYYGARYYDPEAGRFTREDEYQGDIFIPQTLNLYVYVLNNPLKYLDPTGNKYEFVSGTGYLEITTFDYEMEKLMKNSRIGFSFLPQTDSLSIVPGLQDEFRKFVIGIQAKLELEPYFDIETYYKIMDKFIADPSTVSELDIGMAIYYVSMYGENTNIQKYKDEKLNRFDREIIAWTNYWNRRLKGVKNYIALDPNLVKAVMYQESKVGTYGGARNGIADPMQVLDKDNPALTVLAGKRTEGRLYGIPKSGYGLARLINEKKLQPNPMASVALGVRWLAYKIHWTGIWHKGYKQIYFGVLHYNGNISTNTPNGRQHRYNYAMQVMELYQTGIYWWWNKKGEFVSEKIFDY